MRQADCKKCAQLEELEQTQHPTIEEELRERHPDQLPTEVEPIHPAKKPMEYQPLKFKMMARLSPRCRMLISTFQIQKHTCLVEALQAQERSLL